MAASLALAVAMGSGVYLWQQKRPTAPGTSVGGTTQQAGEAAVLNFEDGSELRGPGGTPKEGPELTTQHLRRNQLKLTVFLPLGSPDGTYELQLVSDNDRVAWTATGKATIKEGLTSVSVDGDLRQLTAGKYAFRFRRSEEAWREKSVIVQ